MTFALWAVAIFCAISLTLHIVSATFAVWRCHPRQVMRRPPPSSPGISIVRPVCGIDYRAEETLRSTFALDYPRYEIIFCVASAGDPVIPLVRKLIVDHPHRPARLIVGDERISINPKLNNCVKGWLAAEHDWIVLADSNVQMPRDYLQRLLAAWEPGTGLVCSPPVGSNPVGFWSDVECMFLNTYQARWQYAADTVGLGFAQGKTMFWRRDILESHGGIRALASEVAEDAASTKLIRNAGYRVRLVDAPFAQPIGPRRAVDVWKRQVRWARLRRSSFPAYYTLEILSSGLVTVGAGAAAASVAGLPAAPTMLGIAVLWYGAEMLLASACHWPVSWRTPITAVLRDVLLFGIYAQGWRDAGFEWRGNAMRVDDAGLAVSSTARD